MPIERAASFEARSTLACSTGPRGVAPRAAKSGIIWHWTALECNEIGDSVLEVRYKDNKLERLCTDERDMRRRRPDIEKKLRLRVKALEAAQSLGDLPGDDPGGRWHELNGNRAGTWAGDLSGNWRLIVEPAPINALNAVKVTVIDIEDYH